VKIRSRRLPQAACVEIADNGYAFASEAATDIERQTLALLGIQERVRPFNGQFAIKSIAKRGRTARVEIPLSTYTRAGATRRSNYFRVASVSNHQLPEFL
jgi:signal transduction histidine kinase